MRVVLQRVKEASVKVATQEVARIGQGICLLVGVELRRTPSSWQKKP